MNDLRKLFIDTCEDYKNIVDTFTRLSGIISHDIWDTQMNVTEKLFLTTMKFIYKSRYPENINAIGSHYRDFITAIFDLIFSGVATVYADGEYEIIETLEDLWEFWINTTNMSVIETF